MSMDSRGAAANKRAINGAAGTSCSKLSSASRNERWASKAISAASASSPCAPRRAAINGATAAGSSSAANSIHAAPSANNGCNAAAAASAKRDFPTPGGPISVTQRAVCSPSNRVSAASSASRPSNGVGATGKRCDAIRVTGGVCWVVARGRARAPATTRKAARSSPANPKAFANCTAVARGGTRAPVSYFRTNETEIPARTANWVCVNPSSRRHCLSKTGKVIAAGKRLSSFAKWLAQPAGSLLQRDLTALPACVTLVLLHYIIAPL